MLRVAVIGLGWAGTRQVEAIRELGRKLTVECLVDNEAEHVATKALALEVSKTYVDYCEALEDPRVDAVSICTPHASHCQMTLDAAAAGKHILVEKPMALTVADATRMINAANASSVKLYVAESAVYTTMADCLRDIAIGGTHIGELTFASFVSGFRAPEYGYPGRRAWLSTPELGGTGTWMLHGIHSMAQLRYILGEVDTVYMGQHRVLSFSRPDLEATMSGMLTLSTGVHVSVVQTAETRLRGALRGYALHGDHGSVRGWQEAYAVYTPTGDGTPQVYDYPPAELSSYALEMEAFADYVAGAAEGPTTGVSERRSLAIVQAGYESAQSHQPVVLSERFGEL